MVRIPFNLIVDVLFIVSTPVINRLAVNYINKLALHFFFKAHPSCLQFSDELTENIRNYDWECEECKLCVHCQATGHEVGLSSFFYSHLISRPLKETIK